MEFTLSKNRRWPAEFGSGLWRRIRQMRSRLHLRQLPRSLRVAESVSLGEKRLLAIVECDGQRFLVGGGSASVTLVARLAKEPDFSQLLTEWCERQR